MFWIYGEEPQLRPAYRPLAPRALLQACCVAVLRSSASQLSCVSIGLAMRLQRQMTDSFEASYLRGTRSDAIRMSPMNKVAQSHYYRLASIDR